MPVNKKKGGKKHRKAKKNTGMRDTKSILMKEDDQEYGQVTSVLGNCRFRLLCADGKERLGIVRGKMRKRQWVRQGSFVIVGIREYEDGKCDIFHVYPDSQNTKIKKYFTVTDEKTDNYLQQKQEGFVFGNDSDNEMEVQTNEDKSVSNNDDKSETDSEFEINIDDI